MKPRHAPSRLDGARCVVTGGLGFIGSDVVHRLAGERRVGRRRRRAGARARRRPRQRRRARRRGASSPTSATPAVADAVARRRRRVQRRRAGQPPRVDAASRCATSTSTSAATSRSSRRCGTRRPAATIVQTSTRQVYGRPRYLPVDEDHPTAPGRRQRHRQAGVRAVPPALRHAATACASTVLRLTNVYGPRQHLEREGLGFLPVFVRQALLGEEIVLFGDGTQRRDCVHVDDVVEALLLSATTPEAGGRDVQPRPRGLADAGRDRPAHPGRRRQRRRRCAACRGPTSCCASTSAASRATSPRPSGSSGGRRASPSPTASTATVRSLRRSIVVPVVDLRRRHRRFQDALRRRDRPRPRVRAPCCSAPSWRRSSASSTPALHGAPTG